MSNRENTREDVVNNPEKYQIDLENINDPAEEVKKDPKFPKDTKEQQKEAKSRAQRIKERIELYIECQERGRRLNPKVFFQDDDEFFKDFVKTEKDSVVALRAEQDIVTALTFLRWLQKKGYTNAPINYEQVEY